VNRNSHDMIEALFTPMRKVFNAHALDPELASLAARIPTNDRTHIAIAYVSEDLSHFVFD